MQIMIQHCAVEGDVALGRRHGSLLSDRKNQWWITKALDRGSRRSVAWVMDQGCSTLESLVGQQSVVVEGIVV